MSGWIFGGWPPPPPGAGGAVDIGDNVGGGTPKAVLFIDALGKLAQDPGFFEYDKVTHVASTYVADFGGNFAAGPPFGSKPHIISIHANRAIDDVYGIEFLDPTGHRTSYFGPDGAYYTGHFAIISGYTTNFLGQAVSIDPAFPAPNASTMLSIGSDVQGPAVAVRSPSVPSDTDFYLLLGGAGPVYATPTFTVRMDADGSLRWGSTLTNLVANYDFNFSRMSAAYGQFFGTRAGADVALEVCNQAGNGTNNTTSLYLGPHSGFSGNPVAPGVQGFNVGNNGGLRLLTFDGAQEVGLSLAPSGDCTVVHKFGCNNAAPQAPAASGGALAAYATGVFGLDTNAHMLALFNLVAAMRAALVANGVMS